MILLIALVPVLAAVAFVIAATLLAILMTTLLAATGWLALIVPSEK